MNIPVPEPSMAHDITFITVVEAGALEQQVLRMVGSLRAFGGRLAGAPVLAVRPRPGPRLAADTRRRFDRLGIDLLQAPPHPRYAWYGFMNKPVALTAAARSVTTPALGWLDADLLVFDEPPLLTPGPDLDLVACAADLNLGSTGPGCRFDPFWEEYCRAAELPIDRLGWVQVHRDAVRARTYFNGGVFSFRQASGFASEYSRVVSAVLDAQFRSSTDGFYFHEQMAIGVAARRLGLRVGELPWTYNFANTDLKDGFRPPGPLVILHYHEALYPPHFDRLIDALAVVRPDRVDWVRQQGPLDPNTFGLVTRGRIRLTRWRWGRLQRAYAASCRVVDTATFGPGVDNPAVGGSARSLAPAGG